MEHVQGMMMNSVRSGRQAGIDKTGAGLVREWLLAASCERWSAPLGRSRHPDWRAMVVIGKHTLELCGSNVAHFDRR